MTQNYAALGEYTAFRTQARDAATRRFVLLSNLSGTLHKSAEVFDKPLDIAALHDTLDQVAAAERELHAALARANQAGALCGKPEVHAASLLRSPD